MATATRNRKANGGRSRSQDKRVHIADPDRVLIQADWRVNCIVERLMAGKFTEKNFHELARLEKIVPAYTDLVKRNWTIPIAEMAKQIAYRDLELKAQSHKKLKKAA